MPNSHRNTNGRVVTITEHNRATSDLVVAIWSAGAGYGKPLSLEDLAKIADVPLSDLFGAVRRRGRAA